MLKVGLIGLGYLGKIHLKCLKEINDLDFVGIYDIDTETKKSLADQYNIKAFESMQELIDACDVVDIVTPSQTHFEIAKACIRKGRHVFIEKPVTPTVEEAKALQVLAEEAGIKVQVGHVERFNPAFIAAKPYIKNPQFIEIHRLAQYNPRGTDVSVTLDLMIHDLDLLLSIVGSNVKKISASGVNIVSPTVDMVNARIEFDNGCVANVTSNRVSLKNMRKFRIFQENSLVSINLLEKVTELIHVKNASKDSKNLVLKPTNNLPEKELIFEHPIILPSNAIKEELSSFIACIAYKQKPVVGIENAIDVLSLAYAIDEKISHATAK
jgi:predicted dehydrogenase